MRNLHRLDGLAYFVRTSTRHINVLGLGLLLFAVSAAPTHAGLTSGPEYDTLQALYSSTNGAAWTDSTGWLSGDACGWFGVTCDQDSVPTDNTSHVHAIVLSSNHLVGLIPSLASLTNLYAFDAGYNQLSGPLPSLAGLSGLHDFEVPFNQLSGGIPAISQLGALQYFSVEHNNLTGPLPLLSGLSNLVRFEAGMNQLTGSIPTLTGLTSLTDFFVEYNSLTGSLGDLSTLNSLQEFYVNSNQLSGPFPDVSSLPNLQVLAISNNQFTGSVSAAPASLIAAMICPNPLDTTPSVNDFAWNGATSYTPWWADPYPGNHCDDIFTNRFED